MNLTFRVKLLASHAVIALVAAGVAALAIELALGDQLESQIDRRLESQARGLAQWLQRARHYNRLADRLSAVVGAEVTIIDENGVVIGDSERETHLETALEGEANSPEVQLARAGEVGRATRDSIGSGVEMRYVAVPGPRDLVVRLGVPTSTISETRALLRPRLLAAASVSLLVAIVLAGFIARALSRRVATMRAIAEQIGRGDYHIPPPSQATDEFGVLSRTLAMSAEKLLRLDAMRREFVANAAHELRTPVTAIRGYAETLASSQVDPATMAEFVEVIHRNTLRISRLVDDLLQLQALESDRPRSQPLGPVSPARAARNVVATMRAIADPASAEMIVEVDESLRVRADADELEQVLQNLVENAVKYGGAAVRVRISARRDDGRVAIEVSDNGPGIPASALPQIFERFYRVDKGRSRKDGGAGLGLAIVKQLVESMGGRVEARSSVGDGTTFTVELDAA